MKIWRQLKNLFKKREGSRVKIMIPGTSAFGTAITIDGIPQKLIYNAELKIPVDGAVTLKLERYITDAVIEGNFRIDEIEGIPVGFVRLEKGVFKKYRLVEVEG